MIENKTISVIMACYNCEKTLEKAIEVEDHVYYLLTTSFGIETYEAYLRWCAKAKKMLKNYYKT